MWTCSSTAGGGLHRDSQGRFFSIAEGGSQIAVFSPAGQYIGALGRLGQGPGEFSGRGGARFLLVAPGDTVLVIDAARRLVVFAPNLDHVHTVQLPGPPVAAGIANGGALILSARRLNDRTSGQVLHLIRSDGAVIRSYAHQALPNPPSFVMGAGGESLWTLNGQYGAREFKLDGQVGRDFRLVEVPWWRTGPAVEIDTVVPGRGGFRGYYPRAAARISAVDSSGLLWFSGNTLEAEYTSAMMVRREAPQLKRYLEAFDPVRSEVVVSLPDSLASLGFVSGTSLVYRTISDGDALLYKVFRLRVDGRE